MNCLTHGGNMAAYLTALKANGVDTLKNSGIDTVLLTAANWFGDRFVDSITTITTTSPFAGTVMSLAINGADLAGKVLSTKYSNNDWTGTILRTVVAGVAITGTVLVTPSLAGRVGIEISKEVMLRFGITAILEQILRKGIVPVVSERINSPEKFINYTALTLAEVNDATKYSDALIVKMSAHIANNPVAAMNVDVVKAINIRAKPFLDKIADEKNLKTLEVTAATARTKANEANAATQKALEALQPLEQAAEAAKNAQIAPDATPEVKTAAEKKVTDTAAAFKTATEAHAALKAKSDPLETQAVAAAKTAKEAKDAFDSKYPAAPPAQ